jgi:hypothetical protein
MKTEQGHDNLNMIWFKIKASIIQQIRKYNIKNKENSIALHFITYKKILPKKNSQIKN